MKPLLDRLSSFTLTAFKPVIVRDSPEGTKYLHLLYALRSHFGQTRVHVQFATRRKLSSQQIESKKEKIRGE